MISTGSSGRLSCLPVERILGAELQVLLFAPEMNSIRMTGALALEAGTRLLESAGISVEDRVVLLLLPHSVELFVLQVALTLRGQIPAVLPWPTSRIDAEKYQRNLLHQLSGLPATRLLTLPRLARNLVPGLPFPATGIEVPGCAEHEKGFAGKFEAEPTGGADRRVIGTLPEDTMFLQFSGGTTGTQKCVVVREGMMRSQMERLGEALDFSHKDVVVSWLPMYHDMGLIACLWQPLWWGATSVQMGASDWLLAPERLCEAVEGHGGTFSWLPNFAFSYLAQRRDAMRGSWDLSSMRGWVNCSEPVRLHSMRAFQKAFADQGVCEEHLQASYAMAETVFAVTQTVPGSPPKTIARGSVNGSAGQAQALTFSMGDETFVSSGKVLKDIGVRVRGWDGGIALDGAAGEIEIEGPCVFDGYWGASGFSRQCFAGDGWYKSGDYGVLFEDELFVIGRSKDLIIVGGQNIFPEDVEFLVNQVEGVYPGRVVAFGVDDEELGTQVIAVVAELRPGASERAREIERALRSKVKTMIGVAPRYVHLVPERWILKSTAGKISRKETREKFAELVLGKRIGEHR